MNFKTQLRLPEVERTEGVTYQLRRKILVTWDYMPTDNGLLTDDVHSLVIVIAEPPLVRLV